MSVWNHWAWKPLFAIFFVWQAFANNSVWFGIATGIYLGLIISSAFENYNASS